VCPPAILSLAVAWGAYLYRVVEVVILRLCMSQGMSGGVSRPRLDLLTDVRMFTFSATHMLGWAGDGEGRGREGG
jgi:hypothetical protein